MVKFSLVPTVVGVPTGIDLKIAGFPEDVGSLGPGATFANTLPLTVRRGDRAGNVPHEGVRKVRQPLDPNAVDGDDNDNCKTSLGTVEVTPQYDLARQEGVGGRGTHRDKDQGESLTDQLWS